jgi:hypothetical protein
MMKPKNAKFEFEKQIRKSGMSVSSLTTAQGIGMMLDFYRNVRADGCELDGDGDMLLFQWGHHDFGEGESFQVNITRQFMISESDEDESMSQLSLTFHYIPSADFVRMQNGSRWCSTPFDLEEFESFISSSEPHRAVASVRPAKVTLDFGEV